MNHIQDRSRLGIQDIREGRDLFAPPHGPRGVAGVDGPRSWRYGVVTLAPKAGPSGAQFAQPFDFIRVPLDNLQTTQPLPTEWRPHAGHN